MIDLNDKHIIVTGGELSIIKGIIKRLQGGGAKVTLVHHNSAIAQQVVNSVNCDFRLLDWENLDKQLDEFARFDSIDGAIICPEWNKVSKFVDSTPADWDSALYMNYESAVYLSQAIAKQMIANKNQGSIVFLTSVTTVMPMLNSSVVGTSLAILRPLVKMVAVDCGQYSIRANMIAMGWIETESSQEFLTSEGREFIEQGIPLQTVGKPEDVGDVCCFLMSDLSQYVTGMVLTVDGGYTLTRSAGSSPFPQSISV